MQRRFGVAGSTAVSYALCAVLLQWLSRVCAADMCKRNTAYAQVLECERLPQKGAAGRRCSWRLAEELVAEVDLDRDGTVSYEEYRAMWLNQEPVAA